MTPDEIRTASNNVAKPLAGLALINPILAALPMVTVGVGHLIAWIQEMRTVAQRTGEWTQAQNQAFEDALITRATSSAYLPDPPKV